MSSVAETPKHEFIDVVVAAYPFPCCKNLSILCDALDSPFCCDRGTWLLPIHTMKATGSTDEIVLLREDVFAAFQWS